MSEDEHEHQPDSKENEETDHSAGGNKHSDEPVQTTEKPTSEENLPPGKETKLKQWWHWVLAYKKFAIPAVAVLVLAVIAAVPQTRYGLAGLAIKQSFPVLIIDAETGRPVSSAKILLDGKSAITNNEGRASLKTGVGYAKLFLIESGTDKLTVMDEGEATFDIRGWSGDRLIYIVNLQKIKDWEPKKQALKSYHAPSKKITLLAETSAEGDQYNYAREELSDPFVLDHEVVYIKEWTGSWNYYSSPYQNKKATLNSVRADGNQKKVIKTYDNFYLSDVRTAEFGELYILYYNQNESEGRVDEYHNGKLAASKQTGDEFYNETYPYYSVSPTGNKTLLSDYRDGKNTFFVGNSSGEEGQQLGRSDEYSVYGWFTDDYVLLTKKDSEMYIMPADGLEGGIEASLKISDYYKPNYDNRGFGYGYGGKVRNCRMAASRG